MRPIAADDVPCALLSLDSEGRITDANAVFEQWTGLSLAELIGRPFTSLRTRVAGVGGRSDGFVRLANVDGSSRPVIVGKQETDAGEVLVLVDATERAQREQELVRSQALQERTRNRLELIIDSSIAFSAATTEQELVDILATTVAKAYQAEQCAVFLLDDTGGFAQSSGSNPLRDLQQTAALVSQVSALREVVAISGTVEGDGFSPVLGQAIFEGGDHLVEAGVLAPVLDDGAGMGDGGAVAPEQRPRLRHGAPEQGMDEIHRQLTRQSRLGRPTAGLHHPLDGNATRARNECRDGGGGKAAGGEKLAAVHGNAPIPVFGSGA